jgi:uncharacterized lipoprotein YajG
VLDEVLRRRTILQGVLAVAAMLLVAACAGESDTTIAEGKPTSRSRVKSALSTSPRKKRTGR